MKLEKKPWSTKFVIAYTVINCWESMLWQACAHSGYVLSVL